MKLTEAQERTLRIVADAEAEGYPLTSRISFTRPGYAYSRREVRTATLDRLVHASLVRTERTGPGWIHTLTDAGREALAARTAKPTDTEETQP